MKQSDSQLLGVPSSTDQPHLRKKRTRLWLWTLCAVAGVLVLGVVGYFTLVLGAFYLADSLPAAPLSGPQQAVSQFYTAIEGQDYQTAYASLEQNAVITIQGHPVVMDSVTTLTSAAQALDTQEGVVRGNTLSSGTYEPGKTIVDMTIQVTRNGPTYDVHLKLEQVGTDWKILSADGI